MNKNPLFELNHDGDCSCYRVDSVICDCGILRDTIRAGVPAHSNLIICWSEHLAAIEIGNAERNRERKLQNLFEDLEK